ncbi:hypothetical protein M6B38_308500 [Iris pallida]|uniref:Uncharacterized protein n=1 Tax=Iris pallida TaxID=29817 RepID=A0AAX6HJQ7_IRIPA|nr:hypothetical protein M6B38_128930 [Iris pallida]KAJ6841320.1 hypothetical protein M6B38_308500 [Iris pallida]
MYFVFVISGLYVLFRLPDLSPDNFVLNLT